jgi:hypothetical protein
LRVDDDPATGLDEHHEVRERVRRDAAPRHRGVVDRMAEDGRLRALRGARQELRDVGGVVLPVGVDLQRVREATPRGLDRVLYIEQPTARDLRKDRANVMHAAAGLRPIVIDESLTDLETLLLAREMGYSGVALKACKGQTHAMLMAAAAQKFGMFLCVRFNSTCYPGKR